MDNLVDALLNNEILTPKQLLLLPECQRQHNVGYNFGTQKLNHQTLHNYIVYMKCLEYLDQEQLQLEKDRARRQLEMIDCYTDGRDYKSCLSGIWSLVATFDDQERERFLVALDEGKYIERDEYLVNFFEIPIKCAIDV